MRRQDAGDGRTEHAQAGRSIIGAVGQRDGTDPLRWWWQIWDVVGSKYQPPTRGERTTKAAAKTALRRAWRIWLADRGLVEAPE